MIRIAILLLLACFTSGTWVSEMENNATDVDGSEVVEGDMIMTARQKKLLYNRESSKFGVSIIGKRWNKNRIPYELKPGVYHARANIEKAIQEYHRKTCLRFVKRTSKDTKHYISFYKDNGCFSSVGQSRTVNRISIGRGCEWVGTIVHEIAHSLGMWHEQMRPDRDQHVEIIWSNIPPRFKGNFKKATGGSSTLGTPYDYQSIMHYGATAFGSGRVTIRVKDSRYTIGQREGLSTLDVVHLKKMYKCKGSGGTTGTGKKKEKGGSKITWSSGKYKIWDDGQCANTGNGGSRISLSACKKACEKSTRCNAINYSQTAYCVFRHCARHVPPRKQLSGYRGYSTWKGGSKITWSSGNDKIWDDGQCANTGNGGSRISLSACKKACEKSTRCNAINYAQTAYCVFRHCARHVPPRKQLSGYRGYSTWKDGGIPKPQPPKPQPPKPKPQILWGKEGTIWRDNQCPNLGNAGNQITEKDCKAACGARKGCTAVNFALDGSSCVLRGCEMPVAKPRGRLSGYVGFQIIEYAG